MVRPEAISGAQLVPVFDHRSASGLTYARSLPPFVAEVDNKSATLPPSLSLWYGTSHESITPALRLVSDMDANHIKDKALLIIKQIYLNSS